MFEKSPPKKIGISFGAGPAKRWSQEKAFMEKRAKELGLEVTTKFNTSDQPISQKQECKELIDSGIGVLILMPRNGADFSEIAKYAKEKNVKLITYARPLINQSCDLFVGYDTNRIGQAAGMYVTELVRQGNFIVLHGDKNDYNSAALYQGAMTHIQPAVAEGAKIILDEVVPAWSPDAAKKSLRTALQNNNNQVAAIIAANDIIAGACIEVLKEQNIQSKVIVTGMDAELPAIKRIAQGEQELTFYMNLQELSGITIDQAHNMLTGKKVLSNSEFTDSQGYKTPSYLIGARLITKDNLQRTLIDTGIFTKEQVYGK